jgi:hypothetical protein
MLATAATRATQVSLSLVQWNSANGLIAEDYRQIYKLVANANNAIYNIAAMKSIGDAKKISFWPK